jgi:hypothetical protein
MALVSGLLIGGLAAAAAKIGFGLDATTPGVFGLVVGVSLALVAFGRYRPGELVTATADWPELVTRVTATLLRNNYGPPTAAAERVLKFESTKGTEQAIGKLVKVSDRPLYTVVIDQQQNLAVTISGPMYILKILQGEGL